MTRSEPAATAHVSPTLGVVIVAAGNGDRLGAGIPKAFVELDGRTLLEHSVRTVLSIPHAGQLVVVVPQARAAEALALVHGLAAGHSEWRVSIVSGGRERYESVRFGLRAMHPSIETVLVHDAARPLASAALFDRVAAEVRRSSDAVIPALPVVDTLKRVDEHGVVHETVDRAELVAVQTPQGFPLEMLVAAHESLRAAGEGDPAAAPTDDAEVVQRAGGRVRTVLGEARARKLTTRADFAVLEAYLAGEEAEE